MLEPTLKIYIYKNIIKTQTKFHFSRLYLYLPAFFQTWKIARQTNFSRLLQEFNLHFFQTLVHLLLFDENVKCRWIPWSWLLGESTAACNCLIITFMFSITHEIRHVHVIVMQMLSLPWSLSLLRSLINHWKMSVPFLSQGISQACISGRFVLQRWPI